MRVTDSGKETEEDRFHVCFDRTEPLEFMRTFAMRKEGKSEFKGELEKVRIVTLCEVNCSNINQN